jgi:hypothetical protein
MVLSNETMAVYAQELRLIYPTLSVSVSEELLLAISSVQIEADNMDETALLREKLSRFYSLYLKQNYLVNDTTKD